VDIKMNRKYPLYDHSWAVETRINRISPCK
jgi:hypothetical protein